MSTVKLILAASAAALLASSGALAADAAQPAPAKAAKPKAQPPVGGYLAQPTGSQHLRELKWTASDGYPLYVLNRECNGQCAVVFPPLTPATAETQPPSKAWSIRVRQANGALQWVYKGKPVYTYTDDKPGEAPKAESIIPGVTLARK